MLVVRVELWSAISGEKTELARMEICNDGNSVSHRAGNYDGRSFVGRNGKALDRRTVSKRGRVANWRRLDWHVWNLVAAMLDSMGYTNGRPQCVVPQEMVKTDA